MKKLILLIAMVVLLASFLTGCLEFLGTAHNSSDLSSEKRSSVAISSAASSDTLSTGSSSTKISTSPISETLSEDSISVAVSSSGAASSISEDGTYTSKADVALYIFQYKKLPGNFITKKEAQALGWTGGSLEPYAPGKCIGGDYFGNYEGLLPKTDGRSYTECDIGTLGASSRGAKRIVFSNDGFIYYTDNHYESFSKLYGEGK
ncbi:MAG: ribonuclease domain-containing protein [Saccharofermentanales bacterium]